MARMPQVSADMGILLEESMCDGGRGSWKERISMLWEHGCGGEMDEFWGALRNDVLGNLGGKDETSCLGHKEVLWPP